MLGLLGQSYAMAMQGDLLGARTTADEALDYSSEDLQYFDVHCSGVVAVACLAAGDAAAAWEATEAARQLAQPMRTGVVQVWAAEAALMCDDLTEARRWADEAVSVKCGVYLSAALATRARVEVARGALEHAERDAREAFGIATTFGGEVLVPEILESLADVARIEGGQRDSARLLGIADSLRQRMAAVRFKVFDADHEACVTELRQALGKKDFDEAWSEGASLSTEEAIAYVQRGRGERKRPASGWASLTPTERDVVRLVGEGLGNKDVAARLFVSPRTVESHLTHVYTKLGLSSRVQLAQEATRRGEVD